MNKITSVILFLVFIADCRMSGSGEEERRFIHSFRKEVYLGNALNAEKMVCEHVLFSPERKKVEKMFSRINQVGARANIVHESTTWKFSEFNGSDINFLVLDAVRRKKDYYREQIVAGKLEGKLCIFGYTMYKDNNLKQDLGEMKNSLGEPFDIEFEE
ncbi:hypothetical protein ACQV5N_03600 [Leptospira koniambonensis]